MKFIAVKKKIYCGSAEMQIDPAKVAWVKGYDGKPGSSLSLGGRAIAVSVGPDAYAKLSEAAGTPLARFARSGRRTVYVNPESVESVSVGTDGRTTVMTDGGWVDVDGTAAEAAEAIEKASEGKKNE